MAVRDCASQAGTGRRNPLALTSPVQHAEPSYRERAASVTSHVAELGLDALLVTHPPNLRYLAGFDGSMGALLLTRTTSTLIVDGRYVTSMRDRVGSVDALRHVRVELAEGSLEEAVARAARAAGGLVRVGVEGGAMTLTTFHRMSMCLESSMSTDAATVAAGGIQLIPTERVVERVRLIKDAVEVGILRTAAEMLSAAAVEALAFIQPGRTERDIAADVDGALRRVGFARPAFDTIVAAGPNSALPHARPGLRRLAAGDGVVLDFGGAYDGYCVDLTRTVQLAPSTEAFGRLFDAVKAAQVAAITAVRPGVRASSVDAAARDELVSRGLGDAFMHGTGHGLGLEVHEEPRVTRIGTARPDEILRPGMVFTIEPGAYVPGVGGVRIEDDVIVTEDGCDVLTAVPIDRDGYGAAAAAGQTGRCRPAGE